MENFENTLLKKIVTKGIGWLALKRIFAQIISTTSNLVLVRLLFPDDFGSFAIIQFLTNIIWIFADLGLGKAIVQRKKDPDPVLLRSVWWTQLGLGLLIGSIIWLIAPVLLSYYAGQVLPRAVDGLRWLIVGQILMNLGLVSASLLERHLRYSRIVICELIGLFITQLTVICLAFLGLRIEALVFGILAGRSATLIVYIILSPWSWGFSFDFKKLKSLLNFGISYQFSGLLAVAGGAILPLFLGKFPGPGGYSGSQAVGFVIWAGGVAALTLTIGSVIEPVIFPIMSRLQNKPEAAEKLFVRILKIISITAFPGAAILLVLAPEITKIIFTPRWLPALTSLRLGIIQTVILGISNLALLTLLAFGDSKYFRNINFLFAVLQWLFTIPLVLTFGFWGYNLAGLLVSLTATYSFIRLKKHFKINFLPIIILPLLASAIIGILTFAIKSQINISNIYQLLLIAGLGSTLYLVLIYFFNKDAIVENFKTVREIIISFRL